MTVDKLRSVFEFYQKWIRDNLKINPCASPDWASHPGHLAWMCQTAIHDLIPNGRIEKAMRWLGFIQGVLVAKNYYTLEEVKSHSRSEPDENERLAFNTFKE